MNSAISFHATEISERKIPQNDVESNYDPFVLYHLSIPHLAWHGSRVFGDLRLSRLGNC
jgi:hypothetical protein